MWYYPSCWRVDKRGYLDQCGPRERRGIPLALNDADLKILWSRSAGLCAFPDCRKILVHFSKADNGMYQIGEMAHLIAHSLKGPRGTGPLAKDARDTYENHILLCPNCHTEIDKNSSDCPVEKLVAFKIQHEHWVAETLLTNLGQKIGFLKFYSDLLKALERILQFDKWTWLVGHLWRDLAPTEAIESAAAARMILLQTIWPGNRPRLEAAIKKTLQAWSNYCENFTSACKYRDIDCRLMVSAHIEKWMSGPQRWDAANKQNRWSNKNGRLLLQYVRDLNHLVDIVREELLPTYRQDDGYFLIHDDLGYRNDGNSVIIKPIPVGEFSPAARPMDPADSVPGSGGTAKRRRKQKAKRAVLRPRM